MASFRDLEECTYTKVRGAKLLAIGWLDTGVDYPRDPRSPAVAPKPLDYVREAPAPEFVAKRHLITSEQIGLGTYGGLHVCNLEDCPRGEHRPFRLHEVMGLRLGAWNIFVRHPTAPSVLYCAPNLLLHYVVDHHYRPPDEFIDAVHAQRAGDLPVVGLALRDPDA